MKTNFLLLLLLFLLPKTHAQQIASFGTHTFYLSEKKELWAWGSNNNGQLGTGNVQDIPAPKRMELDFDIAEIHAGANFSMALSPNGDIWGWGINGSGQIGLGEKSEFKTPSKLEIPVKIEKLSVGNAYALAMTSEGTLWGWGSNSNARLGLQNVFVQKTPVILHPEFTWKEVSAASFTSAGIRDDGTIWAWGSNIGGLLGTSSNILSESFSPLQISNQNDWAKIGLSNNKGFAIKNDSTLWGWGEDFIGEESPLNGLQPLQPDLKWKNIACITTNCAFLDEFDRIWELKKKELVLLDHNRWKQVFLTPSFTVGLQKNGEVYSWGWNHFGTLGIGISGYKEQPTRVDLPLSIKSLGQGAIIAIGEDKSLYTWGTQSLERLFLPASAEFRLPLKTNRTLFKQISTNINHALGIKENGELYAWGNFYGWNGATGLTQIEETKITEEIGWIDVKAAGSHALMLKDDGSVFILGDQLFGSDRHFRKFSEEPVWDKISVGENFSILVKNDGTLWVIGRNNFGQLGIAGLEQSEELILLDDSQSYANLKDISSSGTHTLVIREDGTLWGWGHNFRNHLAHTDNIFMTPVQLGTASDWKKISAGRYGSLFLKEDGSLWASGENIFDRNQKDPENPSKIVQVGNDNDWKAIAVVGSGNVALKEGGSVWTWGNSFDGVLGTPDAFKDEYQLVEFQEEDNPEEIEPPVFAEQVELDEIHLGSILAKAEIIADGGSSVMERGFVYATHQEPSFANQIIAVGSGTGVYQAELEGFQPNSTYYFRAFAINKIADTVLTEAYTITTEMRLPEVILHPFTTLGMVSAQVSGELIADGGGEVQKKGFVWSSEDEPDMENYVYLNSEGDGLLFSSEIEELKPGKVYFISAFATNAKGTFFTEAISFQTLSDTLAPAFEKFRAENILMAGRDNYSFDISLSDHSDLKQVLIKHKGIRTPNIEENWTSSDNLMHSLSYYMDSTYHIGEELFDELGIVFYVEATDIYGNTAQTEKQYVYRAYGEESPLFYTLPHYGVKVRDYRLLGVPLELDSPTIKSTLAKDFANVHSALWRIFGISGGALVELNDSHSLTLGQAYWFISAINQPLHFTGSVAKVDHDAPFIIKLEPGWNMISNPYPFDLNWEYIESYNKTIEVLSKPFAFNGEYYEEKVLKPFEGVFIFASESQSLKVPIGYEKAPSQRIGGQQQDKDWHLNFLLEGKNGQSYKLSGLGMGKNALLAFDHFDLPLLPRLEKYVDLHFTDKSSINVPLTRDVVPFETFYQWEFVVNSSEGEITLSWAFENFGNSELWLLNMETKERIDMCKMTRIKAKNGSKFKVIYTDKHFENSGFISTLLSPYPNPASFTVSIPYTLKDNMPYEIRLFDSSGRLVEIVDQGIKKAGAYIKTYPVGNLPKGVYQIIFNTYKDQEWRSQVKSLIIK